MRLKRDLTAPGVFLARLVASAWQPLWHCCVLLGHGLCQRLSSSTVSLHFFLGDLWRRRHYARALRPEVDAKVGSWLGIVRGFCVHLVMFGTVCQRFCGPILFDSRRTFLRVPAPACQLFVSALACVLKRLPWLCVPRGMRHHVFKWRSDRVSLSLFFPSSAFRATGFEAVRNMIAARDFKCFVPQRKIFLYL